MSCLGREEVVFSCSCHFIVELLERDGGGGGGGERFGRRRLRYIK